MSYELIDNETMNKLFLSIEVLNKQVKELSEKSNFTEKKFTQIVKLENYLGYKTS